MGSERGDADAELGDGLPFLEGEGIEFPPELLRTGFARAFVADPQVLDCVPGFLHGGLPGQRALEIGWNRT
jgi:hypothetical protein